MKSNYKILGEYIQQINNRNTDLKVERLLGVSIQKILIPSIANIVGTNMKTYKIINKNQFAYGPVTSRNGNKVSIALSQDFEEAIVSQAYTVFEIIDQNKLMPEYLMMWFRRPEFDRYARFKSHGSARETFDWEEMCNVELPVPSIEKQKAIVKEYNTIVNRIKLNEELNKKLEETAQAIYKQWFVDFEFPNKDGKPYKSSGGRMVWNEELGKEIPEGWEVDALGNRCILVTKGTTPHFMYNQYMDRLIPFIKGEAINRFHAIEKNVLSYVDVETHKGFLQRSIIKKGDILFSIAGTLGKFALINDNILPANANQAIAIIRVDKNKIDKDFFIGLLLSGWHSTFYTKNIQQAVQANLSLTTIKALPILIPEKIMLNAISTIIKPIIELLQNSNTELQLLKELSNSVLSKMAKGN